MFYFVVLKALTPSLCIGIIYIFKVRLDFSLHEKVFS